MLCQMSRLASLNCGNRIITKVLRPFYALTSSTSSSSHYRSQKMSSTSGQQPVQPPIPDEPIKFSSSNARQHSPFDTFTVKRLAPRYQPFSVILSVFVFLVYFLVLREENDLDAELDRTIFERIPALREKDLLARIKSAENQGIDSSSLKKELQELRLAHK